MSRKYFGTDGVRARVGTFPMTVDFALKLGNATGQVLVGNDKSQTIVLGQDTRNSCDMLKAAFVAGVTAAGMDVINLGIVPTPVVAFMVRALKASAGVVLSASHNPHQDNGIKLFSDEGEKLPDHIEWEIESYIEKAFCYQPEAKFGQIISRIDEIQPYIEHCLKHFSSKIHFTGKKVILDCANGATFRLAARVFERLGVPCQAIASVPNGENINQDCGAVHLATLIKAVKSERADLGIAFDGDGDRLMLVDEKGRVVNGDEMLYILSQYPEISGHSDGVVGTVMSNLAIEQAFAEKGVQFERAKVGDRYVMSLLKKNQWSLGGEASGHIINLNYNSSGDGLITALQILSILSRTQRPLSALAVIKKMPQVMINVLLSRKIDAADMSLLIEDVSFAEKQLSESGRVVLRPSGTEAVLRVMVEADTSEKAQKWAEFLVEKVKEKLVSV